MSKQANKTLVGGFVLGAVALAVAGIFFFGSGKFLTKTDQYVMYFDGSVSGLNVGSPVVFRGVGIGSVTDIQLTVDPADFSFYIPVFIETKPHKFRTVGNVKRKLRQEDIVQLLIKRGLRARLELQSLVTGQLMVDLDFHPDKPVRLVGADLEYMEIPTIPTAIEELTRTLEKVPLDSMIDKFFSTLEAIENIVTSPDAQESMTTLNQALEEVRKLAKNMDSRIGPVACSIEDTVKAARAAAMQAEKSIAAIEGSVGEDSQSIHQLRQTLDDVSAAAESIRLLADYLERHPESLLRGKGKHKGK
jgi:paraquat-inducible protein B